MPIPSGGIIIWSGAIIDIPAGYVLCDGNNGSPDLRDKFIVGAGSTYAVGASGGSATHTHTFTSSGHSHALTGGLAINVGTGLDYQTDVKTDSGTTDSGSSLPPYYALAYIMKT
jgi:hypothetical protein